LARLAPDQALAGQERLEWTTVMPAAPQQGLAAPVAMGLVRVVDWVAELVRRG
jgi:hypothetical protein